MQTPPKRLQNIDALRGLCALLVAIHHLSSTFKWEGAGVWRSHPKAYIDLGRIGVAAFFLVSGYVIPFSTSAGPGRVKSFWCARFFRLWPAYWAAITLAILTHANENTMSMTRIALNYTMFQKFFGVSDILGVFWTLQIELIFYFLVTLLLALRLSENTRVFQAGFYFMTLVSIIFSALRAHSHSLIPVALPMALTLMLLAAYIRHRRMNGLPLMCLEILVYPLSLAPICFTGYNAGASPNDDPYRWMLAYALGLLLFLLFESNRTDAGILTFIGTLSYSIYLFHPIAIHIVKVAMPSSGPFISGFAYLACTIAIAGANYCIIERPSQNVGRMVRRLISKPNEGVGR